MLVQLSPIDAGAQELGLCRGFVWELPQAAGPAGDALVGALRQAVDDVVEKWRLLQGRPVWQAEVRSTRSGPDPESTRSHSLTAPADPHVGYRRPDRRSRRESLCIHDLARRPAVPRGHWRLQAPRAHLAVGPVGRGPPLRRRALPPRRHTLRDAPIRQDRTSSTLGSRRALQRCRLARGLGAARPV